MLPLYTLDIRRLYPGYLIWGRSLIRLALQPCSISCDRDRTLKDKPRTQRALALCMVGSLGSSLAIVGILDSTRVMIDANRREV